MRSVLPSAIRSPVFGALAAVYPKADWAPRPLRAKATFQSLAAGSAAGYARALGVTGLKRFAPVPDVPTISEGGLPGYEIGNWFALLAPSGHGAQAWSL